MEWDAHPSLVDWEFSVLQVVDGCRDRRILQQVEAEYIVRLEDCQRLNLPNKTTLSVEKHQLVEKLLRCGTRYADIKTKVGLSMGMITKIRQRMEREHRIEL